MPTSKKKRRAVHLEETCSILQRVAEQFTPGSVERRALEDAARALIFIASHEMLKTSYEQYCRKCAGPLTRSQEAVLKEYGIEIRRQW